MKNYENDVIVVVVSVTDGTETWMTHGPRQDPQNVCNCIHQIASLVIRYRSI